MNYLISEYASEAPVVLRDFLVYMSTIRGKSAKTAYEYFLDLRLFFRFLKINRRLVAPETPLEQISIQDVNIDLLKTVTLSDLYEFLTYIAEQRPRHWKSPSTEYGLNARSRARKVSALRTFFKYLTSKVHLLQHNPAEELESVSKRKEMPRYLSVDDSLNLLDAVQGPYAERDYCILTLFLNCGIRVSELVSLNLSDIKGNTLRVLGKGNKERILYLNDACLQALERYYPTRITPYDIDKNALFISRNRNRINVQTVKWLVKKYLKYAGLDTEKYSVHKLRHTAATLMYQNGVDVRTLQTILGHANLDTTMLYTHVADQNIADAAEKNPLSHVSQKRSRSAD